MTPTSITGAAAATTAETAGSMPAGCSVPTLTVECDSALRAKQLGLAVMPSPTNAIDPASLSTSFWKTPDDIGTEKSSHRELRVKKSGWCVSLTIFLILVAGIIATADHIARIRNTPAAQDQRAHSKRMSTQSTSCPTTQVIFGGRKCVEVQSPAISTHLNCAACVLDAGIPSSESDGRLAGMNRFWCPVIKDALRPGRNGGVPPFERAPRCILCPGQEAPHRACISSSNMHQCPAAESTKQRTLISVSREYASSEVAEPAAAAPAKRVMLAREIVDLAGGDTHARQLVQSPECDSKRMLETSRASPKESASPRDNDDRQLLNSPRVAAAFEDMHRELETRRDAKNEGIERMFVIKMNR